MSAPDERELEVLAAGAIDDVDVAALRRLAGLYDKLDPVPPALVDRISFGITLDALHAELAELQRTTELVGVRSDATEANTVTFTSSTLTVMVAVTVTSADAARLDGWITPTGVRGVEVRSGAGTLLTEADADGRFVFEDVARGPIQFTFRRPEGGPPVLTPAMEI